MKLENLRSKQEKLLALFETANNDQRYRNFGLIATGNMTKGGWGVCPNN